MSTSSCRFLQPYLKKGLKPIRTPTHARFFRAAHRHYASDVAESHQSFSLDREKRLRKLEEAGGLERHYPRMTTPKGSTRKSPSKFIKEFEGLDKEETLRDVTVSVSGSKLVFFDVSYDGETIQAMCNFRVLSEAGVSREGFQQFKQILRRGDSVSVTGYPTRTSSGELTVLATELPQILSPLIQQIPETLTDPETRALHPHIDTLVNQKSRDIIALKHGVKRHIERFLENDGFVGVNTPLLEARAGGAIARPFETRATEFPNTPISLRIAPELYLKRLVVGKFDKVYEMGPAFRNEGIDATHNPEFTICEFYETFATLEDLIQKTETLFRELDSYVRTLKPTKLNSLDQLEDIDFASPFARLPFIPTIESTINRQLPDLRPPSATTELKTIFSDLDIPLPATPTLPRLLDALAARYIEPLCTQPTFITHHPEILSPLSKSFLDPSTNQHVAARVELFIHGREYVNAYEEENSPFEQRRKFEEQARWRELDGEVAGGVAGGRAGIDEGYLEALEFGLPPTGGWGCGIDRLVMLFAGVNRIADVLPFGTLRNVVALGQAGRRR
ncbi:mitochondrial lysine-tRNA synthetase [Coniosporium apollinis]|uniref:Lysyl-tRNA synthetase n=1 Tax=Coniosporium apollinis TaxID=61459 RepID=A0ABQ9P1Z9_9PEZI|nr:mitochondrial lysine-tRNA synthetase [Coniosporium apollinis]